jgi:hypothetical protein
VSRKYDPPQEQSAFHRPAQRNAFGRRYARLQSRSFARWNQSLTEIAQVHGCFSSQSFLKALIVPSWIEHRIEPE